jgi:hypothetical protein
MPKEYSRLTRIRTQNLTFSGFVQVYFDYISSFNLARVLKVEYYY